jgi:serine/threonine protein kinase
LERGDPDHIGPFRLLGRIGAGGMGVVYLAESADGRRVALKMIRTELTQDPVIRQRFLREVTAARQVRSPVTAQVLDADPEAYPPWVAFEYIDSPNLDEVVEEQLPRLSAAVGILSGIAEALMAIHEEGIIHRDLKPSNILCPPNGVKVIDFGIAAAKEASTLTASGLVGTPAWLSPEQLLGQPLTPAVDVFAWGCIAVFTLTGRLPFADAEDHPAAIYYRIVNTPPDLSRIPPKLMKPVSAALSKDPRDRPPVAALLDMLLPGQVATDPGPAVTPPTPTVVVGPPPTYPPAPTPVLASAPAGRRGLAIGVVGLVLALIVVAALLLTRKPGGGPGRTTDTTLAPATTTATTATTATTVPATTTLAPGTAPPQPDTLPGFSKQGPVVQTMIRVFQGQGGTLIPQFPWSMNGCSQRVFTVRWRALGPAITAGMTSVEQLPVNLSDVPHPTTGLAALMQGDGCSQPAFFFDSAPVDTLEDIAIDYQVWVASP